MNMHSKAHFIFLLLNSGKNLLVIFYLLLKRKCCLVYEHQAVTVTGDLICTVNKTAFSTSAIGATQNTTQIFEGPWKTEIKLMELFCFDKFQFWYI